MAHGEEFDKLDLLDDLLPLYGQIFQRLAAQGVEWAQMDEPILVLDLPQAWKNAFERTYNLLQKEPLKKACGDLLWRTTKVMKGMLTGPVTMLMWSFPREDIALREQAQQLALALRDEVLDLQTDKSGCSCRYTNLSAGAEPAG